MRFLHKLYARLFGYFWLPCPICGRMFGGHEVRGVSTALMTRLGSGRVVCPSPRCNYDAGALNTSRGYPLFLRFNQ